METLINNGNISQNEFGRVLDILNSRNGNQESVEINITSAITPANASANTQANIQANAFGLSNTAQNDAPAIRFVEAEYDDDADIPIYNRSELKYTVK